MADIILAQDRPIPATMQVCYKDMGDGTHAMIVSTGATLTEDGELWTTETERENDVWVSYGEVGIAATKYILLIDLDGAEWPHVRQGQVLDRIDGTSLYYSLDLSAAARGQLGFGVITRINATNADISYFTGIPFLAGANQEDRVVSLRAVPSQVKLDFVGAVLGHGITNRRETDVAAVNTGAALSSPAAGGTTRPGLGDLILKVTRTAGTISVGTFAFYHTQ